MKGFFWSSLLVAAACGGAAAPREDAAPPQVVLEHARVRAFRGERLAWSGRAEHVEYFRETGALTALAARAEIPAGGAATTAQPLELRAAVVQGNLTSKQAEGSGGVEARGENGVTARTQTARLDGEAMTAWGTDPVEIRGRGAIIKAASFSLDLREGDLLLDGGVATSVGTHR